MALITCPECDKQVSDKATSCPHCGYPLATESLSSTESAPTAPKQPTTGEPDLIPMLGRLLILGGIICAGYFLFWYSTAVSTQFGEFNNVGLMQDRQLGLIAGAVAVITGILIIAFRARK